MLNSMCSAALVLLLLAGCVHTGNSEITCRGPNNHVLPPNETNPGCRTACQTEEFLYSICGDFDRPRNASLQLHILVPEGEVISLSVTEKSGSAPVPYERRLQRQPNNCSHILHVTLLSQLSAYTGAVVRVETPQEVRLYAMFFMEDVSTVPPREWLMSLGYILTAVKTNGSSSDSGDRPDTIDRFAAIVSRPVDSGSQFRDANVKVQLQGWTRFSSPSKQIQLQERDMSTCSSGVWCTFEVKQANWQLALEQRWLMFEYILASEYVDRFKVLSPQQLQVVDLKEWRHQKSHSIANQQPDARATPRLVAEPAPGGCSADPETATCGWHQLPLSLMAASVMLAIAAALLAVVWRRRSNSHQRHVVIALPRDALRQQQDGLVALRERLRSRGYRLIIKETLDVGQLRATVSGSPIFIVLEGDEEAMQPQQQLAELELLTTPEKSRYSLLRGRDALSQVDRYVNLWEADHLDNAGIEQDVILRPVELP